ncbi:hypothetical protein TcCL_NonESM03814 [Trypanosoma cruzi]|nr:hypothetical protein TcCL_NonESM03814 [Trypanosoma cruzi]
MFGRRSMARTNDLWEGDVHCDEKEENAARRPPRQGRSEVVFCPLARGRPATWSVRRIIIFASLRLLFIPLRFHADLRREICKKFLQGVRAVVGKADPPEKRYFINLFLAGSSCRFTATLFCGFDACVSERFGLCPRPTRMWCARRREGACQPFYCLPLWLPPLPSSPPEVLRLLDTMFWRRRCRSYRPWYFDSGIAVRRH